jgi:two-component system response regulator AtoC
MRESHKGGELDHNRSIFLDEVGELPPPVKLLRVLEDHKVLRIGGRTPRTLDMRFVAAANRDLEVEVARGNFRQDLYFRLNGISFVIPPLRARSQRSRRWPSGSSPWRVRRSTAPSPLRQSLDALVYAWPGNVRELCNVIERAAVPSSGDAITPADLPQQVRRGRQLDRQPRSRGLAREAQPSARGRRRARRW